MKNMSAMEIGEGSMSRMAEENKSEEMMARVSFLQQLFDRISSPPISDLLGELKLDEWLLNTLKTNLQSLDAILDDAESKAKYEGKDLIHADADSKAKYKGKDLIHADADSKVRPRLDDLKEVDNDFEDLPDKIAIERLFHQFESKPGNIESFLADSKAKYEGKDLIHADADSKVQPWSDDLKEVDYDFEDLPDKIAIERLLPQFESKPGNIESFLADSKAKYEGKDLIHADADSKVRPWLDDLKEVGYDFEDLLDKIAIERLRHQFESKPGNIESFLEKIISPNIRDQLEEISRRMTHLLQRGKEELGLSETARILRKPYPLSAAEVHVEDEAQVYGRDEDKNAIIELLLSDNQTDDPVTVISIVGRGGVGKTTLARLVYDDYRVSEKFDLKGWAYLSPDLPVDEGLSKAFSEAFSIVDSRNTGVKLNEILNMKKFLLVLDDVPCSWLRDYKKMHDYLVEGAKGSKIQGSKILLTTRLKPSGYRPKLVLQHHDLKPLNYDGSWMLFVKHAFADKEIGLHPGLEAIGKNIVTKCGGLPLLIVTLGAMLRFKPSVEEWDAVLRKPSDSDIQKDIISILWMSYNSLHPNLKRCFAYCSIFPKDHEYDKEKLVLLWMAEGFLQHSKHRRIEEVGHEYFDDLTSRSFFQKSAVNSSRFVMHSSLHEFAQLVSGEFCFSFINNPNGKPSGRVRHMSLSVKSYQQLTYNNTSHLRTLLLYYLPPGKRSTNLRGLFRGWAKYWQCLRVLSFSHGTIVALPDSIGALKLLQYLDLSHTKIIMLPNSVTTLYNLQTLLLSYCCLLSKLPKKFRKLVYLRHLDIRETCLKEMPAKMGCLTNLQSLSDFVVGKRSGSNIRELAPLKDLRGNLCISQLQNVTSAIDASEANLKDKADLKVLELKWSDATANSQLATNLLETLEPHQNLEKLSIISYNGISFADWVGDSSFSKMVFLHLSDCNSCSHLPPLGQLPTLKELIIEGMRGVKKIGPEFFGVNNVSANPFPSLEILVFREMPEWEGWIASEMQPLVFPCLKRMCIKSCPKYGENHLSLCLPPSAQVEIPACEETEETVTVEKQLLEGDRVQVRGKEKLAEENLSEEKMAQASILQQLYGKISSVYISEFFSELKLDAGLLNNLNSNLLRLDAILDDAESKAYKSEKVKEWFGDLKAVSYDLEDLLDEIAYKRVHYQLESKPLNIKTGVQRIISPIIGDRLEKINSRITPLLHRGKDVLHLSEGSRILREPYLLSAAKDRIEDECLVCGRDEDKEAIIDLLLSDHVTDNQITVLSIVSKNVEGKTALARVVYNDYRVSKQFDLKGWAYLSPDLPVDEGLSKAFSEAFGIVDSRNIGVKLNEILNMKKFLLVLDDVPRSWHMDWKKMHDYLVEGAKGSKIQGSKILLTTRLSLRGYGPKWFLQRHVLKPLNYDGSWMLFVKHAFADKEIGLHPRLEAIGKNIVTKCYGLPLLIVTLGAMLRFMPSVEEWDAVLMKLRDLTEFYGFHTDGEIAPVLRMSYDCLPPNLKRCFAYCSTFPCYHEYDKEKLVLLWMAEGFLQHSKGRRIEEVGREYFDDLTSRSFFQKSGANSSHFVMHSLVHKVAQSVSGEFCFSFSSKPHGQSFRRVRHLSLSIKLHQELIYCNTSQLRTLLLYYLPSGESSTHLSGLILDRAKNWQSLRVLSLSHGTITKWPDSLKLLQYLDLSHTKITRLPNIVTTLHNLQTLLLSYCRLLSKLPKKFRKLVYLRHLDIRETCLQEMPAKMGCLTNLQSLSDFVVGKCSGSNIRELAPLKDLRGNLCISQLQNVTSAIDVSEANLKDKADLKVLELKWNDSTANSWHATNVLEKLEPHQNLEKLSIISYNGISFPDWVGDSSFSKMAFLHLSDCDNCSHLPPLGQLPSLKKLIIEGMRGVKKIGPEFFGVNNVSANAFPSLEILVFREMPEWEEWSSYEMHPVVFPCLKRVCIKSCPKYVNRLSLFLPPSIEVEISASEETPMLPTKETLPEPPSSIEKQLRPSTAGLTEVELQLLESIVSQKFDAPITPNRLPEVEELQSSDSNSVQRIDVSSGTDSIKGSQEDISSPEQESMNVSQLKSLPPKLYSLKIEACDALEFLPTDLNMLNNLQDLYIVNCHLLKSIRASYLPKALKTLHIRKCKEVEFLSTAEKHNFLENLCIESSCDSLESFPLAIFPRLSSLSIWDCAKFNSLSITEDHMFLDALEIRNCTQFISFPKEELGIPNLTSILLSNCKNLKVLPGQLHGLTSLQSLFINECPEVDSVPEGGLPSSLNLVCISFCHKLTPCIEWGLRKLNDFSRIEIEDGSKDLESFPEQNLLPWNLISLRISRLPNLKVLDYKGLQHLTSLKTLKINSCNKLHSLPDGGLPSSLRYLYISDCPLLSSKLQKRRGREWIKIAHIPHIQIDGKVIS